MGRKGAPSREGLRAAGHGPATSILSTARWPTLATGAALGLAGAGLLAALTFGPIREAATADRTTSLPAAAPSARAVPPPKPALTREEEGYIQALWPIHGDVQRSALRVSLGSIFYKTDELPAAELKARLDTALATYRSAAARIEALRPPESLAREQASYLAAVRLFERSAVEALRTFEDGDDGHLLAAFPLSREGGEKIREVGVRFWRDEFPAH